MQAVLDICMHSYIDLEEEKVGPRLCLWMCFGGSTTSYSFSQRSWRSCDVEHILESH